MYLALLVMIKQPIMLWKTRTQPFDSKIKDEDGVGAIHCQRTLEPLPRLGIYKRYSTQLVELQSVVADGETQRERRR